MNPRKHPRGFTLIEISLTLLISGILIVLVTANYQRANQDSLLQRESSLFMSRLRLVQEQTAAGTQQFFCYHRTGLPCTCALVNGKCAADSGTSGCSSHCCPKIGTACEAASPVPPKGFMLAFSCYNSSASTDYALISNARQSYYYVADRTNCFGSGSGALGACFPPEYGMNDSNGIFPPDGIATLLFQTLPKGDTQVAKYTVDSHAKIQNVRVTWAKNPPGMTKNWVSCGESSPWQSKQVPNPYSAATDLLGTMGGQPYPIAATIRYLAPDGREVKLSDNVAEYAPLTAAVTPALDLANPVTAVEIMFGLTDRPSASCRVVKVTNSNVVTQYIDADCNFATPN